LFTGGEGEIRTHGTLAGSTVFESVFAYSRHSYLLSFGPSKSITSGDFNAGCFVRILSISAPRICTGICTERLNLCVINALGIRGSGRDLATGVCFPHTLGLAPALSTYLRHSSADLDQFQVFNALEVGLVSCVQRQAMHENDSGHEAVADSDRLTSQVELPSNFCSPARGVTVKRQHMKCIDQPSHGLAPLAFVRAAEKLERCHGRGLNLCGVDVFHYLVCHWLGTDQEVDQNVCVSLDPRPFSRSSVAIRLASSPSFSESDPSSDSRVLRRFSRSASPSKKLSIASPSTPENPFSPRRDARASKALRCSGFILTVVPIPRFYAHMHVSILWRGIVRPFDFPSRILFGGRHHALKSRATLLGSCPSVNTNLKEVFHFELD
jgi:hypothetical protein